VTGGEGHPALWTFETSLWGRHPTALELALDARPVPGTSGSSTRVVGNPLVRPETAAAVGASYARRDVLSGAGVRGEVVRVVDPIVLKETGTALVAPANAADETGGIASLWVAAGDTSRLSGRLDVSLLGTDASGALNSLTPVPTAAVLVGVSLPFGLFESYVRARMSATLEYESGLARGPWAGLLDDSRLSLSVAASGEIDSARFFIAIDDVLSGDSARVPGMEPAGTTLSAGFSWSFRD
jgi:hypothetical protein